MTFAVEHLQLSELVSFLREQAYDAFPDLKDERRLAMLSEKWHSHAKFCTCQDNGRLVGMIAFYANQPDSGVVYITHVYVNNKYRGQKLMTTMMNVIKEYVKIKGFHSMRLEVRKKNKRAQRAYSHYGFECIGEASEQSIYMQCLIP